MQAIKYINKYIYKGGDIKLVSTFIVDILAL